MRTSFTSLLILALLLCGCKAAQNPFVVASQDNLTAVTTPTLYRYQPQKGIYKLTSRVSDPLSSEVHTVTMIFHYDVSKTSDGLLWDTALTEVTEQGTRIAPKVPLATIQGRTDESGLGNITKIASPWLDSMPGMEKEAKELIEDLRKKTKEMAPPLTTQPVITGQALKVAPIESCERFGLPPESTMSMILAGEFSKGDSRYVLGKLNEKYTFNTKDIKLTLMADGYSIMKKDTMETIYCEVNMNIFSQRDERSLTISMVVEKL